MRDTLRCTSLAALVVAFLPGSLCAQGSGSALPPMPPTAGAIAPLAGLATPADRPGSRHHRAQVTCAGGELEIRADNSGLNSILRLVAQCTGMKITGGVADQRVFGNYGPAQPATVLATLLDGTDTNVLLRETAADQPAELILTPRTGGPTPPGPNTTADDDADDTGNAGLNPGAQPDYRAAQPGYRSAQPGISAPAVGTGVFSGPVSIPQPINNVNGSPSNTSPNAGNYPTTNSVPLDSLPTPSTTPHQSGIVEAPNPPPAGSDTAALLNGRTTNMPGNITITAPPSSPTTSTGATDTTQAAPADSSGTQTSPSAGTAPSSGTLTPQQVYEQLQKLRQQQQSGQPQPGTTNPQPQ